MSDINISAVVLLNEAVRSVLDGTQSAEQAVEHAQEQWAIRPVQPAPEQVTIAVAAPTPEVQHEGITTIRYLNGIGDMDAVRRLAQTFNETHPDIRVEIKDQDVNGGPQTLRDRAATMDCFPLFGTPPTEDADVLLDLQPLIDADPTFELGDYPAPVLAPYREGNTLRGLPNSVFLRFIAYNPAAFDQAGIAHPDTSWTFPDVLDTARRLTSGSGDTRHYGITGATPDDIALFLDRYGARVEQGSGSSARPNFTDPTVRAALESYITTLQTASPNARVQGYARTTQSDDSFTLFVKGRVGNVLHVRTRYGPFT